MFANLTNLLRTTPKLALKGFEGGSLPFFLSQIKPQLSEPVFVVTTDTAAAFRLKDQIAFFAPHLKTHVLMPYDILPYHGLSPQTKVLTNHLKILALCLEKKIDVILSPFENLLRRHMPVELFVQSTELLLSGQDVTLSDFAKKLVAIGYTREPLVEERGQFALRGDILDVFSPQFESPIRVSFFGKTVESLKVFDPATQRTGDTIFSATILPASEIFLEEITRNSKNEPDYSPSPDFNAEWRTLLKNKTDERHLAKTKRDQIENFLESRIRFHGIESFLPLFYKNLSSIFDYCDAKTIFVDATATGLHSEAKRFFDHTENLWQKSEHIESIFAPDELFLTPSNLTARLQKLGFWTLNETPSQDASPFADLRQNFTANTNLRNKISAKISKLHNLEPLVDEINAKRHDFFTCILVCQNLSQKTRIADLLGRFELPLKLIDKSHTEAFLKDLFAKKQDPRLIHLLEGDLHEGFLDEVQKIWWISDEEIFGKKAKRAYSQAEGAQVFNSFSELVEGDFLIHRDHGIGLYRGLVTLDFDVYKNDFLAIEYLGGDKLYVPVDKLNLIQRFSAEEGTVPQIDKLGGTAWKKIQSKAKKAARLLAGELLKIQALRNSQVSYAFQPHTAEMEEFAATFPFEETPDQLRAIEETLGDMQSDKPMDRLVCGDVGYGKTEVALRAAFLATLEHKQVAILVPTTVLAFQHYKTCVERFRDYPLSIEFLSRFRPPNEQKQVLEKLKAGAVDIVIGTHRLLSQDIKFRDLGLLIIDEEHRFGVIHKEKIKKLKSLVDVMTLTATPIPRTLNFALNGIRDLSIINTPPVDRLAIKTHTTSFDPPTLRDAMLKELQRGGQIYFVHNRVQSIERVAKRLQDLMPEARVRFGHGQMEEDQLEKLMLAFMKGEFDILVCTTIIESGLDIPNANTMIIDRADQLGLAQLYQLRGRVGRSDRQAYCYMLVPEEDLITTKAKRRLATLQRFTELGSGFKVASHDLEIRGAGNILGDEQSGHIAAIGYDMYLQLLQEAIWELKDTHIPEDFEPEIKLQVTTKIPDHFIPDKSLRLILYKELSAARTLDDIDQTRDNWLDRFGKLPEETGNLFKLMQIKVLCKNLLVSLIKEATGIVFFNFHAQHRADVKTLMELVQKQPNTYALSTDGQLMLKKAFTGAEQKLDFVIGFLKSLSNV